MQCDYLYFFICVFVYVDADFFPGSSAKFFPF